MTRVDLYTTVHKNLRARLFDVARRAGAIDGSDPRDTTAVLTLANEVLDDAEEHRRFEVAVIQPMIRRADPKLADQMDHDHEELESLLAAVRASMTGIGGTDSWLAFYRALNRFLAHLLAHFDEEEALMPMLWETFSDDELRRLVRGATAGPARMLGVW